MTLSKLAKLANVSVSTASKAFSGSAEVNEETRERIFSIAKENGCFKKFYNAKYPKLVIAILAPELISMFYTRYLSLIRSFLDEQTCELCVSATNFSPDREKHLIDYYYKYANVDGIIVIGSHSQPGEPCEIPIVYVEPRCSHGDTGIIRGNLQPAFLESLEYLKTRGVSSVGFIGEPLTVSKQKLFEQLVRELDFEEEPLVSISQQRFAEGGYQAMEQFFASGQVPRAVICAYDYMAMGAIRCILDHGLSVPEDVAVLGCDDVPEARFFNPPLASMYSSTEEVCRIAAEGIIKQINGEAVAQSCVIPSQLHFRRSFQIDSF